MSSITIEGSLSPAAGLARGERRTVQDTPHVRRYVELGFAIIVDEDGVTQPVPSADEMPGRNESTEVWKAFIDSKGIEVDPDANRDELIDAWDTFEAGSSAATDGADSSASIGD